MNILITTDTYYPIVNGVVTSTFNLKTELSKLGHDVKILTLTDAQSSYELDGVTYLSALSADIIYPGAKVFKNYFSRHIEELIKWKPDVIHSQTEFSTFVFAKKIAKRTNSPLVHTYHTMYEDYTHYFIKSRRVGKMAVSKLCKLFLDKSNYIIAPTQKTKDVLLKYNLDCNIEVIPTGINLNRFKSVPPDERVNELRKRHNIKKDNLNMLFVGRLGKEKNIDKIIKLMPKLAQYNVNFVIVGDGPATEDLKTCAQKHNVSDKVIFTGMVAQNDVADYYRLGNLFVSASTSETQGLTYIEAAACGLPMLCKKDDCLNGIIIDGKNGWQFIEDDDFIEHMKTFATDTQLQQSMSQKSLEISNGDFSSETFALKVQNLYYKAISQKSNMMCGEVLQNREA